jgi:hypothetical protein
MVVIIMTLLFMGTVTLAFFYADYFAVQKVAREGARESCITGSEVVGRQKALDVAWLWGLDPGRIAVEFQRDSSSSRTIEICTVRYIAKPFDRAFPTLVNKTPLQDIQLTGTAIFGWKDFN